MDPCTIYRYASIFKQAAAEDDLTDILAAQSEMAKYLMANGIDQSQFRFGDAHYGTAGGMEYAAGYPTSYAPGASTGFSFMIGLAEPLYKNQQWKDMLGQWLKKRFPETYPYTVSIGFYNLPTAKSSYDVSLEKQAKKPQSWKKKPRGWKQKSVKQYSKTMMEGKKHPFDACVKKMKGKVDNPEGFCASVKDQYKGSTEWRKTERKKNKKKSEERLVAFQKLAE